MEINIINEAGLEEALIGMKFSFQEECDIEYINLIHPPEDDYDFQLVYNETLFNKYMETAKKLCKRDGGHNKFLEQIQAWMIIRAPLYWWKQFDTYRVGTSKLSKSTMHTLMKRSPEFEDFQLHPSSDILYELKDNYNDKDWYRLQANLPQSFLQTRMVNTNYKVLRNIILQRKGHKLTEWKKFIAQLFQQLQNPELLGIEDF